MKLFPDTAYWRVLKPQSETVDEPNNTTFKNPRAPTIPEEDAKYVPTKHDFDTHIERPVFTDTYQKSMDLIPISNGRYLHVIKMLDVLVQNHFNTHISRTLLTGPQCKYNVNRRGDVIKDKSGKKLFDTETRTKGCVYPAFIAKQNLSHKIKPEEFVGLFLITSPRRFTLYLRRVPVSKGR